MSGLPIKNPPTMSDHDLQASIQQAKAGEFSSGALVA
jgi:hypothetical protein